MKPEWFGIIFADYRMFTEAIFRVYGLRSLSVFCDVSFMILKINNL
jgi:hypothetical protein